MDNLGDGFRASLNLPNHKNSYKNASMWKRFFALIIDLIIVNFVVFSPFKDLILGFMGNTSIANIQSAIPTHIYTAVFFMSILTLLYFSLMQYYFQQTIGMVVMKIFVVPHTGFWRTVTRNLFILPFFPFSLLWIIEPVYLYFKGSRVLEKISGTLTIEVLNG